MCNIKLYYKKWWDHQNKKYCQILAELHPVTMLQCGSMGGHKSIIFTVLPVCQAPWRTRKPASSEKRTTTFRSQTWGYVLLQAELIFADYACTEWICHVALSFHYRPRKSEQLVYDFWWSPSWISASKLKKHLPQLSPNSRWLPDQYLTTLCWLHSIVNIDMIQCTRLWLPASSAAPVYVVLVPLEHATQVHRSPFDVPPMQRFEAEAWKAARTLHTNIFTGSLDGPSITTGALTGFSIDVAVDKNRIHISVLHHGKLQISCAVLVQLW